jgi:hypothetical protein
MERTVRDRRTRDPVRCRRLLKTRPHREARRTQRASRRRTNGEVTHGTMQCMIGVPRPLITDVDDGAAQVAAAAAAATTAAAADVGPEVTSGAVSGRAAVVVTRAEGCEV